jgi:DNA-binding NarL/FixJ family response regulator
MQERDKRLRVLIVENSRILAKRIVEWLEADANVAVVATVDNAPAAIEEMHRLKPDAVIVDVALAARSNGFDVLRAIARDTKTQGKSESPVAIVFTNHSTRPYRDAALRLGAAYFFDKSNDFMGMVAEVSGLAEQRGLHNGSEG